MRVYMRACKAWENGGIDEKRYVENYKACERKEERERERVVKWKSRKSEKLNLAVIKCKKKRKARKNK